MKTSSTTFFSEARTIKVQRSKENYSIYPIRIHRNGIVANLSTDSVAIVQYSKKQKRWEVIGIPGIVTFAFDYTFPTYNPDVDREICKNLVPDQLKFMKAVSKYFESILNENFWQEVMVVYYGKECIRRNPFPTYYRHFLSMENFYCFFKVVKAHIAWASALCQARADIIAHLIYHPPFNDGVLYSIMATFEYTKLSQNVSKISKDPNELERIHARELDIAVMIYEVLEKYSKLRLEVYNGFCTKDLLGHLFTFAVEHDRPLLLHWFRTIDTLESLFWMRRIYYAMEVGNENVKATIRSLVLPKTLELLHQR